MSLNSGPLSAETILGNPDQTTASNADAEFAKISSSKFGQPYLIAVKIKGEPRILHLRVLIDKPTAEFEWASLDKAPEVVKAVAFQTSQNSALAWKLFSESDTSMGLYFDPSEKVKPWSNTPFGHQISENEAPLFDHKSHSLGLDSDTSAESLPFSKEEVLAFEELIDQQSYAVANSTATVKTRGSAQRAFANAVKRNYRNTCALTGIKTREFLIASHIVPWSLDESIRLDPSNGICLSLLVDKAFENGFININDDLTVSVDFAKLGKDNKLIDIFKDLDGSKISLPVSNPPKVEYLKRRRSLK
ncbi:HNH endonuclease (plasmid) [Paracoccus sp. Arc7-R13]|nr:HNH endonuclease [Paracoccus sp. Arc7-R13]